MNVQSPCPTSKKKIPSFVGSIATGEPLLPLFPQLIHRAVEPWFQIDHRPYGDARRPSLHTGEMRFRLCCLRDVAWFLCELLMGLDHSLLALEGRRRGGFCPRV